MSLWFNTKTARATVAAKLHLVETQATQVDWPFQYSSTNNLATAKDGTKVAPIITLLYKTHRLETTGHSRVQATPTQRMNTNVFSVDSILLYPATTVHTQLPNHNPPTTNTTGAISQQNSHLANMCTELRSPWKLDMAGDERNKNKDTEAISRVR